MAIFPDSLRYYELPSSVFTLPLEKEGSLRAKVSIHHTAQCRQIQASPSMHLAICVRAAPPLIFRVARRCSMVTLQPKGFRCSPLNRFGRLMKSVIYRTRYNMRSKLSLLRKSASSGKHAAEQREKSPDNSILNP